MAFWLENMRVVGGTTVGGQLQVPWKDADDMLDFIETFVKPNAEKLGIMVTATKGVGAAAKKKPPAIETGLI